MEHGERIPALSLPAGGDRSIWAIGGGKGGTGKSFVCASLAIHLAGLGEEVILIDTDMGGPNLHTFLGMKDVEADLGHFITNRVANLRDVQIQTPFDGLRLIKGTEDVLFTSNLNYFKKKKLIRHIKSFDARRIIVDIGTGASMNIVDLFLLSNPGVLVINPEPTSIENAYYFLKSCIIRLLKYHIDHLQIQDLMKSVSDQIQDTSRSIYSFLNEVISCDKSYADLLYRALTRFRPCLIINKARNERDFLLGESIVKVVQKYLVIDIDFLGVIPFEEKVHESLKGQRPFMDHYRETEAAGSIRAIAARITRNQGPPPLPSTERRH